MTTSDHSRVPVLEALQAFRARGDTQFGPPGHRQGKGADPRVVEVLGPGVFESDVLLLNGLDDRRQSQGVLEQAQELMADAVGAEHAFFSTCGSSLSVKSAMLAVAGPGEKVLISRNAHKSVISAVIVNGTVPVWVHPRLDPDRHLAHPPEPDDVRRALEAHPDAKGMLLITPTDWGTCADIRGVAEVCHAHGVPLIVNGAEEREDLLGTTSASSLVYATLDGWRRQMVEHGTELLSAAVALARTVRDQVDQIEGVELLGEEVVTEGYAYELDPLVFTIDVRGLGITGYQAAEIARARHHVDFGAADSCRINARLTHADDAATAEVLLAALRGVVDAARDLEPSGEVDFPSAEGLQLESVMRPRDAFFAPVEQVAVDRAVGRVAAEMVTPYRPGVPVLAPGELISQDAVDYLTSAVAAGALIAEAADPQLESVRVVAD